MPLLRYTKYLSRKYAVRILNLIAVCLIDYWPPACIIVILLRDAGESVTAAGIAHQSNELAFEPSANAADSDRIVDDVVRLGLADGYRRKPRHESLPAAT